MCWPGSANYALVRIVFLSVQDLTYEDVRQCVRNRVVRKTDEDNAYSASDNWRPKATGNSPTLHFQQDWEI